MVTRQMLVEALEDYLSLHEADEVLALIDSYREAK